MEVLHLKNASRKDYFYIKNLEEEVGRKVDTLMKRALNLFLGFPFNRENRRCF